VWSVWKWCVFTTQTRRSCRRLAAKLDGCHAACDHYAHVAREAGALEEAAAASHRDGASAYDERADVAALDAQARERDDRVSRKQLCISLQLSVTVAALDAQVVDRDGSVSRNKEVGLVTSKA